MNVRTTQARQVVDITGQVEDAVTPDARAIHVFVVHTTCAVTTADLDPGTDLDLLDAALGAWQRVVLVEFDGPRDRQVIINTLK